MLFLNLFFATLSKREILDQSHHNAHEGSMVANENKLLNAISTHHTGNAFIYFLIHIIEPVHTI